MIRDPERIKKLDKAEARNRALSRASFKCPVAKVVFEELEKAEAYDSQHMVDLLIIRLRFMPEAAATIEILEKIKGFDK